MGSGPEREEGWQQQGRAPQSPLASHSPAEGTRFRVLLDELVHGPLVPRGDGNAKHGAKPNESPSECTAPDMAWHCTLPGATSPACPSCPSCPTSQMTRAARARPIKDAPRKFRTRPSNALETPDLAVAYRHYTCAAAVPDFADPVPDFAEIQLGTPGPAGGDSYYPKSCVWLATPAKSLK